MKNSKKKAFTLAEVLIALTVIGIVSALTIPTLVQKTNKQEYVSALQKAYSTLSQATQQIIAEEGSPKGEEGWGKNSESIYNMFKKYLNNVKECGADTVCMQETSISYKNPKTGGVWTADRSDTRKLIMADGTYLVIDSNVISSCGRNDVGYAKNFCTWLGVDVNGVKKPNEWGRDFFIFVLKEDGLYPAGCEFDDNAYCPGAGCACKVLREGRINY